MAREYKIEIERSGVEAESYIHENDNYETVTADTNVHTDYLIRKLQYCQRCVELARQYDIKKVEISKVEN